MHRVLLILISLVIIISCEDEVVSTEETTKITIFDKFDLNSVDSLLLEKTFSQDSFTCELNWKSPYKINPKEFKKIIFEMKINVECDTTLVGNRFWLRLNDGISYYQTFYFTDLVMGENLIKFEFPNHVFITDNIYFIFEESFFLPVHTTKTYPLKVENYDLKIVGYE